MSILKTTAHILRGVDNIEDLTAPKRSLKDIKETVKDADVGSVGRYLRRSTGHQEDLRAAAVSESRRQIGLEQKLRKKAKKVINKLDKEEQEIFNYLYERGQRLNNDKGGWITKEEVEEIGDMLNRNMDNVWNAYREFKADSDFDYYSLNALERRELDRLGFKRHNQMNVKEVNPAIVDTEGYSRMIINDGTKNITSVTTSAEDIKANYLNKGYKIYEVHVGSANELGLDYTHFLAKNITLKDLPTNILPYAAGGRRQYTKGSAFVKIGNSFFQDGRYLNGWAKTLVAGDNIADLQKYADEVNTAIDMYISAKGNDVKLDKMIKGAGFEKFKINSAEELKDLVKSVDNPTGVIDIHHRAKVLNSGEQYVYDNTWANAYTESADVTDTAMQDLLNMRSRYFRGRSHRLDDINGGKAAILSVQDVWENTIKRASYNATMGAVYQDWARYFKANFNSVIKLPDNASIDSVSELNLIRIAEVVDEESVPDSLKSLVRAAKRTQQTFMRLINTPTKTDKAITGIINRAFKGLIPRRWWDSKAVSKLMNANPVKGAQALVFRATMGFFNPAQLWKQALGITSTLSMEPFRATRAIISSPIIAVAYAVRNNPKIYNVIKRMGFMKAETMDSLIKFMEDHGTMSMLGSHATLSDKIDAGSIDLFFANLGNTINYIVADAAAFFAKGGSKADTRAVAEYADKLALSMTKVSNSEFQHSFGGRLLSQWMTYPMACVETMCNTKLSKKQRGAFLIGQLAMWGVGGTFAGEHTTNIYNHLTERWGVDEETANKITDGYITSIAAEAGYDIREGMDVMGLVDTLFGTLNMFSEDFGQLPKIKAARSGTIIYDTFTLMYETFFPKTNIYDEMVFYRNAADRTGTVTSLKNFSKAMLALNARQFYDRYGDVIKENATATDVLMQVIGIGPIEARLRQDAFTIYNQEKEAVEDIYNNMVKPHIQAMNTFRKTSQVPGRDDEWLRLEASAHNAWKETLAFVERNYPEHAQSLINMYFKEYDKGFGDTVEDRNKILKAIFERQILNRYK